MNTVCGSVFLSGGRKERKPLIAQFSTCKELHYTETLQLYTGALVFSQWKFAFPPAPCLVTLYPGLHGASKLL